MHLHPAELRVHSRETSIHSLPVIAIKHGNFGIFVGSVIETGIITGSQGRSKFSG